MFAASMDGGQRHGRHGAHLACGGVLRGRLGAGGGPVGVAAASASGDEITVTGVAAGETDIVAQANGVEYWVPVRVGG